jgi:hypothetical protein
VWWAESAGFSFRLSKQGEGSQDGSPTYVPDITEANAETIEYWNTRSTQAKHSILAARYSNLVWDFTKLVNKSPPIEAARRAIDSYVAASRLVYKISVQPIHYLQRALELSLSISDKPRISEVVTAMFDLHDRVAVAGKGGTWPFLFDQLYNNKKVALTSEQDRRIITKLEETLMSATTFGGKDFDPFSAQAAASRLSIHYSRVGAPSEVERVIRADGSSFVKDGRGRNFFRDVGAREFAPPDCIVGGTDRNLQTFANGQRAVGRSASKPYRNRKQGRTGRACIQAR